MISRSLAAGLLVAGSLTAAAGGYFVAVRQNATPAPYGVPSGVETPAAPTVKETEGVVTPPDETPDPAPPAGDAIESSPVSPAPPAMRQVSPQSRPAARPATRRAATVPAARPPANHPVPESSSPSSVASATSGRPVESPIPAEAPVPVAAPGPPAEPAFEEIVLPAASVIGLELETTVTSERARVEDRVDARVTRDVFADGRLAIPAGSRIVGAVALVERGGKLKERARLGVRFHTLVLGNGRQAALRTETIYREGDSPSNESSRKIGGAAIGGAVLGAILGGGKGAIAGATAGAAGGTAAVMAGGRNPATLASGSIVTVKLSAPASFEVER